MIMVNFTQLLIASFVTHGFLDFYTFQKIADLSTYLLITTTYLYCMYILPSLCVLLFVISSMYHFGNDFEFFTFSRWSGVVLFSSSIILHYDVWYEGVTYLDVQYPQEFIYTTCLSLIPGLINCHQKPLGGLLALLVGLGGPKNIFLYACLFHAPLGVYRFHKKIGYIIWFVSTIILYFILPQIHINDWMVKLSISIVMSHIVAISSWQYRHEDKEREKDIKDNKKNNYKEIDSLVIK